MLLAVLLAGQTAAAYDVQVEGCALDTTELTRLTTLEMASAGAPSLAVRYRCIGPQVTIGLANPLSGIRVERVAENACCADVETERTLALLASGLYKAGEVVLGHVMAPLLEPGKISEPLPLAPAPVPPPALPPRVVPLLKADPVVPLPAPPVAPPPAPVQLPDRSDGRASAFRHLMGVSGRVRGYNVADAIVGYGVGLDYRGWLTPSWGLGGFAEVTFGSSEQTGGEVVTRVINFGPVVAWRFAEIPPMSFTAEVFGGLSVVMLEGQAFASDFRADSSAGASGMLGLGLVPAMVLDRTVVGVAFEGGALFRAPRGLVNDATAVQVDGVFLGGSVRLSLGFDRTEALR